MSGVEFSGDLPPMGQEAVRLAERTIEPRLRRAVELTNDEIERRQRGGPGTMSVADVRVTGGEITGESYPTDFRWRFLNFGTGMFNRKRKTLIGPKRGRRSRTGRPGALKLAGGQVVANVRGIKARNFIQAGKRAARARAEAELAEAQDDFVAQASR